MNSATRHRGFQGLGAPQLLLSCSGWATSNSCLFGCKSLTTANGRGRKDISQDKHDSVSLTPPPPVLVHGSESAVPA